MMSMRESSESSNPRSPRRSKAALGSTRSSCTIPNGTIAREKVGPFSIVCAERFDLAVLLPNSFRTGLLAWLAGVPKRIGYDRGDRGRLLTDRLSYKIDANGRRLPSPILEDYLAIARRLGCRVDSLKTELYTTPADEFAADRAWERLGLPESSVGRVVCLNTGGAFGPAKNWPIDHFVTLARRLVDDLHVHILVLCGPGERTDAAEIARRSVRLEVVSLADEPLGIGLSKACVRRASLLITTDSGPRHFAAPFDIPVLTLFGPTHIAWTRTNNPHAKHIFHPVPCGPCQQPICPLGHGRCMTELTPENVFKIAAEMLRSRLSIELHSSVSLVAGALP